MSTFTVLDLLSMNLKEHEALDLRCIAGRVGLGRPIEIPDINRPGLTLSGFYDNFAFKRIQIFGRGESAYLEMMVKQQKVEILSQFFTYDIPCVIFTNSIEPPEIFKELAEKSHCPVLQTDLSSADLTIRLLRALSEVFAPKETVHGVLIEVFGMGVLIQGESGVGKSEAALELIERGHRLVADDAVEIRNVSGNILMGAGSNKIIGHHMEIRGIGIINVAHIFGVGAIRDRKQIQLVVALEPWDSSKDYDRIGAQDTTIEILGVQVPYLKLPVRPGRNIPILIETATMNERLKKMGYFSAREFNRNVLKWLESENARTVYFQNTDTY